MTNKPAISTIFRPLYFSTKSPQSLYSSASAGDFVKWAGQDSNLLDSMIFASGIALVAFSFVRRLVWNSVGLAIPWGALVLGGLYLMTSDVRRFDITPEVILLVALPSIVGAFLLELLPKAPMVSCQPQLEIDMSKPTPPPD